MLLTEFELVSGADDAPPVGPPVEPVELGQSASGNGGSKVPGVEAIFVPDGGRPIGEGDARLIVVVDN